MENHAAPLSLENHHIVVTGGAGALGSDVVAALLRLGAHCWIPNYVPPPSEFDLGAHERVHQVMEVDLTDTAKVDSFYAEMPSLWGSVHVAGGFAMATIEDTKASDFERMWKMNTLSCFLSCQAAVRRIRESGLGGRIVNVAARPAIEPVGGMLAYTTSKAGVASLTQCLAKELASESILVNAILPSIIDTPANRSAIPDANHADWPKSTEIAQIVRMLVSPENVLTTGALVPVYGKQA